MEVFTAAEHHDVLVLLVQVAVLLLASRGLGEVAQRLRQPAVVGEILAGILLGPSLLSGLFPELGAWIVPEPGVPGYLLEVVSMLGVILLLLITGLETDLELIRRHARTAIGVSIGGIVVTFSSGFLLGQLLPDFLLADTGGNHRLVFALFVATAMSISAIPVIAKVLMDMNLMRRDIGQTIIAAGMSDDTTGWILLSIVAGLAAGATVDAATVAVAAGRVLAFLLLSFTVGRWLIGRALSFVQDEVRSSDRLISLVLIVTFAWAAMTQALGLEAALGAFIAGVLFGQMPRLPESVHTRIGTMGLAVFAPVFFAVAGLKVDARALLEPTLFMITGIVILVASGGKVLGTYLGARLIGRKDHWNALSYGAGLNARGAMEIIVATVGLSLGILSQEMFSVIVVMAMATSLMAPPALRWVLARVEPDAEEIERLELEEQTASSAIARIHRVLVPIRPRPAPPDRVEEIKHYVLRQLHERNGVAATLMSVASTAERESAEAFLDDSRAAIWGVDSTIKISSADHAGEAILDEAAKDYDLLLLGAPQPGSRTDSLFHPVIDSIVRLAPCPSLIVSHRGEETGNWPPHRILVPTNGSRAARNAAEFALMIAEAGVDVAALCVVQERKTDHHFHVRDAARERELGAAWQAVGDLQALAAVYGVTMRSEVLVGGEPEEVILEVARSRGVDLIVLGTDLRPASQNLFLGPRVARLLDVAPCPILILNAES